MMIAGNADAKRRQPKGIVSWSCGAVGGKPRFFTIPACTADQMLQLQVTSRTAGTDDGWTAPTTSST